MTASRAATQRVRKPAWATSIRFRLTAWYVASLALLLLLLGVAAYWGMRKALVRYTDSTLAVYTSEVILQIAQSDATGQNTAGESDESDEADANAIKLRAIHVVSAAPAARGGMFMRLYSPVDARILAISPTLQHNPDLLRTLPQPRVDRAHLLPYFAGQNEESVVRVMDTHLPNSPLVLQVAMPWDESEDFLTNVAIYVAASCLLLLIASAAASWMLVSRSLQPIDEIVTEAEHLSADDLNPSFVAARSLTDDEVGHLVEALNALMARLHKSFSIQRQFAADSSHELRTPLAILRGEIELALQRSRTQSEYRRVLESCLEETTRMIRIVQDLNILARGDAYLTPATRPQYERIDVCALCAELSRAYSQPAGAKGLSLTIDVERCRPDCAVLGESASLRRALTNLIDNAIAYTPEGGHISIVCEPSDEAVRITIADTGVGIAEEDLPYVFERFYRADKARINTGGSGLGLSIVRNIVELHGGAVELESGIGRGTRVTITLPKTLADSNRPLIAG